MKKFSFPPIAYLDSKVLILGTMPGERSLQLNQYYANPQNQFWKILSFVTGDNFSVSYVEKKKLFLKNKIAIWDVLMHCEREGSLDINISDEAPNDFKSFYSHYQGIEAIFFNGGKAEKLFSNYNLYESGKNYTALPSTSSANTSMMLNEKASIWKDEIGKYL
jgi:hypoxanthine-DNA glycosylase